jgi:hypothetical protein
METSASFEARYAPLPYPTNFDDRASRSPLVMKTRGIVLKGLNSGKDRDAEPGSPLQLSMFDPMVDSRSITEGKDVAGMAE